jgi:hypothetical protein
LQHSYRFECFYLCLRGWNIQSVTLK